MEVETEVKPASKSTSKKSVSNAETQVREVKVEQVAEAMETDELVVEEVKNDPVDLDQVASNLTNSFRVPKLFIYCQQTRFYCFQQLIVNDIATLLFSHSCR